MLSSNESQAMKPKILAMIIIVGALIAGLTIFTLLILFIRDNPKFTRDLGIIPLVGLGFALIAFTASAIAGLIQKRLTVVAIAKNSSDKSDNTELLKIALPRYQANTIIRCALIEGASFFNVLVYYLSGSVFNFAIVVLGLILLFLNMPFPNRVISKLEWLIDSAKEERKMGV